MARHENMGWCTFSVVPCPLAVCSFSLCCHLHSANTSACMPAWWVRSSWTDTAKKKKFSFGHTMPARSCPDCMTWVSELETGAEFVTQQLNSSIKPGSCCAKHAMGPSGSCFSLSEQSKSVLHFQTGALRETWVSEPIEAPKLWRLHLCLSEEKFPWEEWAEQASPAPSHRADGLPLLWAWLGNAFSHWTRHPEAGKGSMVGLQQPLGHGVRAPWHKWPPLLGQTPLAACSCSVLSLWEIKAVSYWELKQCVSHHCRVAPRCFVGQLESSCGSKLHFRCICSSQAWQTPQPFRQHEHLVPFHFSNLIESLSMTWALGEMFTLKKKQVKLWLHRPVLLKKEETA